MGLTIRWVARSEIGRVRSRNEDAWGATKIGRGEGVLLAVADGMGGHPGGNVASRLAIEACIGAVRGGLPAETSREQVAELFRLAHERLQSRAQENPELRGMGTTLTLALVRPDGAWVGHLGDTRLFWTRDGEVALLTRDHSAAWDRVERGEITPEQAEREPDGAWLHRYLGPGAPLEPDIFSRPLDLRAGDRLLLCSDGLGKVLGMGRLAEILAEQAVERAVFLAVEETLSGGAPDNVTMLLADVVAPPSPAVEPILYEEVSFRWTRPTGEPH